MSENKQSEAKETIVVAELIKNYVFKITFPDASNTELITDEPPPLGNLLGPNPSQLLTAAVANCLSSSLAFCLRKSKIEVKTMKTEASPKVERNNEGYWRVVRIDVNIRAELAEGTDRNRWQKCIGIFEKYCVVTGAVREGLEVRVQVS